MKKFTGNFLSGGYSRSLRILRSIALGLVALVGMQAVANAQLKSAADCAPPPGTVTFIAEGNTTVKSGNTSDCYNGDNVYTATIYADDFIYVDSIDLKLGFNSTDFVFLDYEILHPSFNDTTWNADHTAQNMPLVVTDAGGELVFQWVEQAARVDLGSEPVAIAEVSFAIRFPLLGSAWSTDLTWNEATSEVFYCGGGTSMVPWTDVAYIDGEISIDLQGTAPEYTTDATACAGDYVIIKVTSPVGEGWEYKYNDSEWTPTDSVNVPAGINYIQAKSPEGCVTPITVVTHAGAEAVTYETVISDANCGVNGAISFVNISDTNTVDFTYWVVPEAEYVEGVPSDPMYGFPEDVVGAAGGSYWVAVENNCGDMTWDSVFVGGVDFTMDVTAETDTLLCFGGTDASFEVNLASDSATTWTVTTPSLPDSVWTVEAIGGEVGFTGTVTVSGFGPGSHYIVAQDSVTNCVKMVEVEVMDGEEITAYVGYTDAPCDSATGSMWITEVNGVLMEEITDPADTAGLSFKVFFPGEVDSILPIGDTLYGLAPLVYEVFIIQDTCGVENPILNDDLTYLWPILSAGAIDATATTEGIICFGDTAEITVTVLNPVEGHSYVYQAFKDSIDGDPVAGDYIPVDSLMGIDSAGIYIVEVKDADDSEGICHLYIPVEVVGPDSALTIEIDNITPPSCPGGNDGRVNLVVTGGTPPYYLALDNQSTYMQGIQGFGLTEGEHTIYVKDENGCMMDTTIVVDSLPEFIIDAYLSNDTAICVDALSSITVDIDSTYTDSTGFSLTSTGMTFWYNTTGTSYASGTEFVPDTLPDPDVFARGTYYVWAESPYGCLSNMDTVEFAEMDSLVIDTVILSGATCAETWTGSVFVEVAGGVPDTAGIGEPGNYYYAYYNNPGIFENNPGNVVWTPFAADQTLELVGLQEGEYYLRIKDACTQTETYHFIIEGYEPVQLDTVSSTPVSCAVGGADGTITVDVVSGGGPQKDPSFNYIYTLVDTAGTVIGTEWQLENTWDELVAGEYMVYVSDDAYIADGFDVPCSIDSAAVIVEQPDTLVFANIGLVDATCGDSNDGVIGIMINGGIGGTFGPDADPSTDGNFYSVTINGITNPGESFSLELADEQDSVTFGVSGGDFEIVVEDANGCSIDTVVTVVGPAPWVITEVIDTLPSDCNEFDGVISMVVTGGLDTAHVADSLETIWYSLDGGEWINSGLYAGDTIPLMDSATYDVDYVIEVTNDTSGYFCSGIDTITIKIENPFDFVLTVEDALCYGTNSGTITLDTITGGTEGSYYQVQIVNVDSAAGYQADVDSLWWPHDTHTNAPDPKPGPIIIENVPAGTYWIYLRSFVRDGDDWVKEYTLAKCCRPVEAVVGEPDSLQIEELALINNVDCYGDSTGSFEIMALGGTPPYEYYVERTWIDEGHPFPPYVPGDSVVWLDNDTISGLTFGTYVVWVKDANGCIVGGEIDENGDPVDKHRIVIATANAVVVDSIAYSDADCYGDLAYIELYGVYAGDADSITFMLEGVDMDSVAQTYTYGPYSTEQTDFVLDGIVPTDTTGYYVLSLVNDVGCDAGGDTIQILPADYFVVDVDLVGSAGCVGDTTVLIVISHEGGTAPENITYDIYQDGNLFKENTTIPNHVVPIGYIYEVWAYDSEDDCTVKSDPLNVAVPELIDFVIEDVTCYGAEKASAKITVTAGTEDREFQVWYREFEGQVGEPSDWTLFNGWFTESIVIADTLVFDDVNILDVHYEFYIEDDNGCKSQIDTMTFDMVDGPLQVIGITEDVSDCQTEVSFVIAGGTAPYMVMIDSVVVVDSIGFNQQITLDLGGGQHEVFVLDANTCTLSDVIEVTYGTVRDTTIETLAGTEAHFVDAEAGVDTMLAVGEYSFGYAMDTICGAVLNVTVLERGLLISDIQGMADTSAMVGDTVMISGTITGIWAGNGFFMQDESAAWSGIAVQYPDTDTLEIGEGATVVGVVTEWEGITTIVAGMVTVGTADVEITPVVVASPSLVKDEMYESVLVMVEGAGTTNGLEDGMWAIHYEVTDFAVVDTVLYKPADTVVVAGHNYDVTGIVNGYASLYLLEPRMAEDIVDLTIDDVEKIGSTIEFKVYPNPFNDKIRIDNYDKLTRVVVSNIAGQRVIDIEYPNYEIRTANLVSGVYVVSLFTEDGLAKSERIIKR